MKKLCFLFPVFLILFSCQKDIKVNSESLPEGSYVDKELIVGFNAAASSSAISAIIQKVNVTVREQVLTDAMRKYNDPGFYILTVQGDIVRTIEQLRNVPEVAYAEPNNKVISTLQDNSNTLSFSRASGSRLSASPDYFPQQWNLAAPAEGSVGANVTAVWPTTKAANVVVGIINAGIQYTHEDLTDNIWVNPNDPLDGKDNDRNGYVDDVHGWNFAGRNNIVDGEYLDIRGTRVAGILGAADNAYGITGAAPEIKYISAKFITAGGGSIDNVVKAIDYFINLKVNEGVNIVALDNSWSTTKGTKPSKTLQSAIERANNANILFVAGVADYNVNLDQSPIYPASYPNSNVIAVGASNRDGSLTTNSDWGSSAVDLMAPGQDIWTTDTPPATYDFFSGSFHAAPHVTAACALYAAVHPGASAATIKNAILSSVTDVPALHGKCAKGGVLNVEAALAQ